MAKASRRPFRPKADESRSPNPRSPSGAIVTSPVRAMRLATSFGCLHIRLCRRWGRNNASTHVERLARGSPFRLGLPARRNRLCRSQGRPSAHLLPAWQCGRQEASRDMRDLQPGALRRHGVESLTGCLRYATFVVKVTRQWSVIRQRCQASSREPPVRLSSGKFPHRETPGTLPCKGFRGARRRIFRAPPGRAGCSCAPIRRAR
jgi:hypothetical protein